MFAPYVSHWLQHVSFNSFLRYTEYDIQALFAYSLHYPVWDNVLNIDKCFAASLLRGSNLYIPSGMSISDILSLFRANLNIGIHAPPPPQFHNFTISLTKFSNGVFSPSFFLVLLFNSDWYPYLWWGQYRPVQQEPQEWPLLQPP